MPFIPESIKLFRERAKISQFSLATLIEVTPQSVLNYEKGRTKPNTAVLDRLYQAASRKGCEDIEFYKLPERNGKS